MRNTLLTTTALVMTAGFATAEVTFSGKGEMGFAATAKTALVAKVAGLKTEYIETLSAAHAVVVAPATGVDIALTAASVTATASSTVSLAAAKLEYDTAVADLGAVKHAIATGGRVLAAANSLVSADVSTTFTPAIVAARIDMLALAQARFYAIKLAYETEKGTAAVAAKKAGDMTAYSGYDLNVAVSGQSDNGMTYSMGFDMGAGSIADQDDDRVLDAQGSTIGTSALTIGYAGTTVVVGQNKIDDLYDDSQNGDISVSGTLGSITYTVVADLDDDTKAVAASQIWTNSATAGADTYVETAAVAAIHESTSMKVSGAAGAMTWALTTTDKNDTGSSATKVKVGYGTDALTVSLTHDTKGSAAVINTLSATYVMDALTLTLSGSDDKNHAGNKNTNKKASSNVKLAYSAGALSTTFASDESSQWWVNTKYDLGGGASAFATVDHNEFAVLGLSFAF